MRISSLTSGVSKTYTCNVYLVQGDWDGIHDVNTLIDVGTDPLIMQGIKASLQGIGKKKIDQVLLTHGDFDHVGILPEIKAAFNPVVYAGSTLQQGDRKLEDGQLIKIGDKLFTAIYAHAHGIDSVCFFCEEEGVVFIGDVPVHMCHEKGSYSDNFLGMMEFLACKEIKEIYPGHGEPILKGARERIANSLIRARKTRLNY